MSFPQSPSSFPQNPSPFPRGPSSFPRDSSSFPRKRESIAAAARRTAATGRNVGFSQSIGATAPTTAAKRRRPDSRFRGNDENTIPPTAGSKTIPTTAKARRNLLSTALLFFALAAQAAAAGEPQPPLARITLHINGHLLSAEVAATEQSRRRGLMFRPSLADGDAMLFRFAEAARHCLWMRDTLIPLSAAFIGANGAIINIVQMHPKTETRHCAAAAATYALETPQGWFAKHGINPGDAVIGLDETAAQ